jgi:thioredoxin-dependent peroxiredoxin
MATKKTTTKKSPAKPATSAAKLDAKPAGKTAAKPAAKSAAKVKPSPKTQPAPVDGALAPAFALEGTDGKTHRLADYRGKNVILYFYPKDDTPGCTREAIAFEAAAESLAGKNAVVLGVSKDSIASHCRFQAKYGLRFVLLSDPDLSVHGSYGAYGEKVMYGQKTMGVLRSTFVIGADGRIKKAFPKVKVDGHDAQVLAAL